MIVRSARGLDTQAGLAQTVQHLVDELIGDVMKASVGTLTPTELALTRERARELIRDGDPDMYSTTVGQGVDAAGGNLLARWSKSFSERSDLELQAYYDHTNRKPAFTQRPHSRP